MKKLYFPFAILFFSSLILHAQSSRTYSFEFTLSGNGEEAILFIPGFACSQQVWDETKSRFEKDYSCYTLTMAGFAGSPPEENPSIENWKDEIAEFIIDHEIDKPIVVGHSMGGGLALAIAADYPHLIGDIVVVDALPCLAAMMNPAFESQSDLDCTHIVEQMTSLPDEQFYQMQKMTANHLMLDTAKQELMVKWSMKSDRRTFAQMYCDFSNTDLRQKIGKIEGKALILLEADFKKFKSAVEEQYKNLKNANLQYSNNGSHFIMYDDKEWFFNQLDEFISGS